MSEPYLRPKHNPCTEYPIADVNVVSKQECHKNEDHKDDTGDVDQCCNKLRVVEDGYLHFPCLEGEDKAHNLKYFRVEEEEQIAVEGR